MTTVVGDLTYAELVNEIEETSWLTWRDEWKALCDILGVRYISTSFGENIHTLRNHFRRLGYFVSVELTDEELIFTESKVLAPESHEIIRLVFNAILLSVQFDIYSDLKREYALTGLVEYQNKDKFKNFTKQQLVEHSVDIAIDRFNKYFKE